jgi:transcriptional regulator with XRE-family HTH domain
MTSLRPAPWEQTGYGDIVGAARSGDGVDVSFANGETVTVSPGLLGVPGAADFTLETDPEDPTRLRTSWADGTRDVDWSVIRAATDELFASELRARDTEESHRFGRRIRALRENRNLAQADVAKLADMAAPQLSKLEKGESDMRLSTLRSLLRAMNASFEDISGPDAPEFSGAALGRLAKAAGVHEAVVKLIAAHVPPAQIGATLGRAFGWSDAELNAGQLGVPAFAVDVRFKASSPQPENSPLLPMAHCVSAITAAGFDSPVGEVPADPRELRRELLGDSNGPVTLEMLLGWAWAHGILVIPLMGPGGFHAAVWSIEGRPVIVVKESRTLVAFWLFDIAHELGHIARGHLVAGGVVDLTSPTDPNTDDDLEREATDYALELLLPDHEALIADIHERAKPDPANKFKWVVKAVAEHANLSPSLLGVAAAYQLTDLAEPKDRWGSATNLGAADGSGRETAESYYRAHVPLAKLTDIDAGLIRSVVLSS